MLEYTCMEYIDITLPLSDELATYPNNEPFRREEVKLLEIDGVVLSRLSLGSHSGTHIDAPSHFVKGGKTVDQIPPEKLIGPCTVIDCTYVEEFIRERDLVDLAIQKEGRILIKTRNSDFVTDSQFMPNFVSVSLEAAQFLANRQVSLVGIDYLSIEAKGSLEHPVHKAFLKHEIVVVEGLTLRNVQPGEYQLICLPLPIVGADGSPCRALLVA